MGQKYKLNLKLLEPGDIILVGYNDKRSRAIQQRTNSRFSHAMLVWYDSLIHAADLVITENPSRQLFDADEAVCALRLKNQLRNDFRVAALIDYARKFVGTLYDKGALKAQARGNMPHYNPNRQMCSKFVAKCFEHVCSDLVDDYDKCTPEELYNSPYLDKIEPVLIKASQWDEEYANSADVTKLQYDAILKFIIELYDKMPEADIMSLRQLEDYISKNPAESDDILELLHNTGYFELWSKEEEFCPYLYDAAKFKQFWKDDQVTQAFSIIRGCKRIILEKGSDIDYYHQEVHKIGDLKYYNDMIVLRQNIIRNANKRIAVAEQVLTDNLIFKISYPTL